MGGGELLGVGPPCFWQTPGLGNTLTGPEETESSALGKNRLDVTSIVLILEQLCTALGSTRES